MVIWRRISDILRHKGQVPEPDKGKKEEKKPPFEQTAKEEPAEAPEKIETKTTEDAAESKMQVAKAMRQMPLDPEESRRIYNHALEAVKHILNNVASSKPIDLAEAYTIIQTIVDHIVLGDKELILLVSNYSEDNYLYAHLVNVCILSIDVGFGCFGYNKSKLNTLGVSALLHDVGMTKVIDIAKQSHKLNAKEYDEIKGHPIYGSDILKTIKDIEEEVISIVKQHHERLNGEGYPEGLEDYEIHEYARIIAVVDTYEAMTHPRNYREAISPHEAIKELYDMNSRGIFETRIIKIVKTLINRIGLYPVGSWVELNSGGIAKVVAVNDDFPLRPKVNVIFAKNRERLPKIKPIDLSRYTNIYIKQGIDPQKLNLKLE